MGRPTQTFQARENRRNFIIMKKNNIFKHELNESIQADAAMNCLKNRNNHKQINEVAPVVAAAGRMLLPMLKPIITKLVQKALVKIGTHARPAEVLKLVMGMLTKGELAKKMAEKCGQTWNEIPSNVKKEIQNAIIDAFKAQSPQEQEENVDYAQLAEDVVASYRGRLSKMDEKERVNFISTMVMKKIGKTIDTLTPQEKKEILAAAKHSMWYVSEQEEFDVEGSRAAYYSQDEPDYNDDSHGIRLILNMLMKRGDITKNDIPRVQKQIKSMLDAEGMWIGDDESEAQRFIEMYWDNQEQEEMTGEDNRKMWKDFPRMEQRDIILAVAEYLAESWIDTGDDGDLDDIYYAVEYLLDSKPKSKECPQSPAWEDCKPWCSRHYKDVEEQISNQLEF
jgi:hypothetical protein